VTPGIALADVRRSQRPPSPRGRIGLVTRGAERLSAGTRPWKVISHEPQAPHPG